MKDRPLTVRVELSGGQQRLKQIILYVAERCSSARFFGAIKLNKIIWRADFVSFAKRHVPVTGREYCCQKFGPALKEMLPVYREMLASGAIVVERRDYGDGIVEHRTIGLDRPIVNLFSQENLSFVDEAISHYWGMTRMETSDESHGMAWKTQANSDQMPYELAFLSDEPLSTTQRSHVESLIYSKGWVSE